MEPPNILQQTQSDIHSQTVISIPFRNAIFTLPSRLTVILSIVAFHSSVEKNCNRLVVCQYSVSEGFNFPALAFAPGTFRVNLLDPIRCFVKAVRQAVVLSVVLCLVEGGVGVLTHDLPDAFGYDTHLDLQGFFFCIQFRRVGQLPNNRLHIVRDEIPLRQQLIEGRQKLLLNHQFAQVRRLASSSWHITFEARSKQVKLYQQRAEKIG